MVKCICQLNVVRSFMVLNFKMASFEDPQLKELFEKAALYLRTLAGELDSEKLLYFYARFKQVCK